MMLSQELEGFIKIFGIVWGDFQEVIDQGMWSVGYLLLKDKEWIEVKQFPILIHNDKGFLGNNLQIILILIQKLH
jgi:hypothetical protein